MCKHPGDNHSTDTVQVWHGAALPLELCGYHASRLNPAMFKALYAAGILPQHTAAVTE